jgi:tRNA(fMet)-specific endonuclease VapC
VYCLDTDVLSALMRRDPPLEVVRRAAATPAADQCTTSVTLGELLYGAAKRGSESLAQRVEQLILATGLVLPFDEPAARDYGRLRAELERDGRRLAEPDLRIASIALSRGLTLVTGNTRHFARVPGLHVENWFETR